MSVQLVDNYLDYLDCVVASTTSQDEDEEQWVKDRMLGIGGSDVGSICGVNKYSSARLVYLIKTGQYEQTFSAEAKERMAWGHKLEPLVAEEFAARTGKHVVVAPATYHKKGVPYARANVDRLIVDDNGVPYGVLECKTADARLNKDWEEGEIPLSYIYQLQWYLWITGLEYGAFAALIGGNKYYYYEVYRNDDLLNEIIIPETKKFWEENVMGMVQPEISGSEADSEYISESYTEVVKDSELDLIEDEYNELAEFIKEGKQQIKELTKQVDAAINKLKEKLQDKEIGYTQDYTVKWSPRTQSRIDTDRLKIEHPEVWEKCRKTTSYRVFTVK